MGTTTDDDDDATDDGRSAVVGRSTTDTKQKIRKSECYHNCVFLWHYSGVNLCYYNQHTLILYRTASNLCYKILEN